MRLERETIFHGHVAQAFAEEAGERLPDTEPHRRKVWELAEQILFKTGRRGRPLSLVAGGLAAIIGCYTGYVCLFGLTKAEASLVDVTYQKMREQVKTAPVNRTMHRIEFDNGLIYKVTLQRRVGDPYVFHHVVPGSRELIAPEDLARTTKEISDLATDG